MVIICSIIYYPKLYQIFVEFHNIKYNWYNIICAMYYLYYKIILIGPGSPLDYPELRINDLNRMINENPLIIITMMKNQEIYHQNQ